MADNGLTAQLAISRLYTDESLRADMDDKQAREVLNLAACWVSALGDARVLNEVTYKQVTDLVRVVNSKAQETFGGKSVRGVGGGAL